MVRCLVALLSLFLGSALYGLAASPAAAQSLDVMQGEQRIALVIGNAEYQHTSPLRNPVNDARAMARVLQASGFHVLAQENANEKEMRRAIFDFSDRLRGGGVGLFYFAGHGIQVNGRNYLVPVDATITAERDAEVEAVDVARVLAGMENARNRLNIVILDACRNNPYARSFRSETRGLVSIDAPSGTLVAYATAPGSLAHDGDGLNGLYTGELVKAISLPGLKIEDVFKRVRQAVRQQTGGEQVPWESVSLEGDFMFTLTALPAQPPVTAPQGVLTRRVVEPSQAAHHRRAISCPKADPAAFRFIKELGSLEADDDLNRTTYNFVICEERNSAEDALQVKIYSGVLTGTWWTREEARDMATTMQREGVRCRERGAPYGPSGKNDKRRIDYVLCQSEGKPVTVEIRVTTLRSDATPYPAKELVVDWPQ